MRISVLLPLIVALVVACPRSAAAQTPGTVPAATGDVAAVTAASFAYIDALYKADSTLVLKSVHPTLNKRGYIRTENGDWREGSMSYNDLLRLSARWNKDGKEAGPSSPRAVEVLSVLDHTAVTRVTAEWGTDFLVMAKYPDGWKTVSIVWQTPPKQE
jgi:Putative lumazine-binding